MKKGIKKLTCKISRRKNKMLKKDFSKKKFLRKLKLKQNSNKIRKRLKIK